MNIFSERKLQQKPGDYDLFVPQICQDSNDFTMLKMGFLNNSSNITCTTIKNLRSLNNKQT